MSLEEEKQSQEVVKWLLNKDHKAELWKILAFWEKYKSEWKQMESEFWKEWNVRMGEERMSYLFYLDDKQAFRQLILQHEENSKSFLEWLSQEEKDIWNSLNEVAKEKFYKEYLFDKIVYSWNVEGEYKEKKIRLWKEVKMKRGMKPEDMRWEWLEKWIQTMKDNLKPWVYLDLNEDCIWPEDMRIIAEWLKDALQPGMTIDLWVNRFGDRWVEAMAKEWKDNLKLWLRVVLSSLNMWLDGVKLLAEEWKNNLKPWMGIYLWGNKIWDEWVKILAKERKGNLQPWMHIDLSRNNIWIEWIKVLAKEWKDSLQPWMFIWLSWNEIWDEWLKILAEEWKDSLKPGMTIQLKWNGVWDKWIDAIVNNLKLRDWIEMYLGGNDIEDVNLQDNISDKMKEKVKWWEKTNNEEWVNCKIHYGNLVLN